MAKVSNLNSSLPVPSIQELAKETPDGIPSRYLRTDMDDLANCPIDPSLHLPLIDMTLLLDQQTRQAELVKLREAGKDWGAFQLINYGVPDEIVENVKNASRDFFNLPLQEKRQYAQKEGSLEGYGQAFVLSEEQKLDWNDMIFLKVLPEENRRLSIWPHSPQGFREALLSYTEEMNKLAIKLLGFLAMGLGIEDNDISSYFKDGEYNVRMNFYPPCPQPEKALGMVPHNDNSGVTFLLDCNDMPGLQIRKDEYWVTAKPNTGAINVNFGNIVEMISNGKIISAEHRAVVNKLKERRSIVTFCYPHKNAIIRPSSALVNNEENPAAYRTMSYEEYNDMFFNIKYVTAKFLDALRL